MTEARRQGEAVYRRYKAATRQQIEIAGGFDAAATISRVRKSQLHCYTDLERMDQFIPIDVAGDLMDESGQSIIASAQAAILGYTLSPLNPGTGNNQLAHDVARVAEWASNLFHEYAEGIANDGVISQHEANTMLVTVERVIGEATQLRAALRGNDWDKAK